MSDEAFARRFYSDRSELLSLGVPLQSRRDEFTGEELYTLRSENYFLPPLELTDDELAALQTCLYLLEGQFAYAEPFRLALQNLALGPAGLRPGADRDRRPRRGPRPGLLARAGGPAERARDRDLEAADAEVRLLGHRPRQGSCPYDRPVRPPPPRGQLVRDRARPRCRRDPHVPRLTYPRRDPLCDSTGARLSPSLRVQRAGASAAARVADGRDRRRSANRALGRHRLVGGAHPPALRASRGQRLRHPVRESRAPRRLGAAPRRARRSRSSPTSCAARWPPA